MGNAGQEMTLEQWVNRLSPFHLVNREFNQLKKEIYKQKRILYAIRHVVGLKLNDGINLLGFIEENWPRNTLLCPNGHKWQSSGAMSEVCPWCRVKELEAYQRRIIDAVRECQNPPSG